MRYLFILVGIICSTGCNSQEDNYTTQDNNSITYVKIKGEEIPCLSVRNVIDSIPCRLSDLITDIELVRIETNENIFIDNGIWLVGEKYIIFYSYKYLGIQQFSRTGKYIRELVSRGPGPKEVKNPRFIFSQDENQLIISTETNKNNLLNIDLNSGEFLDNIPLAYSGRINSFMILNDSLLAIAPILGYGEAGKHYIYIQNFNSKIIYSKNGEFKDDGILYKTQVLNRVSDALHYDAGINDTLYSYNNKQFKPYFILNNGERNSGNIVFTRSDLYYENENYFLINSLTKFPSIIKSNGRKQHVLKTSIIYVDKVNKTSYHLAPFINDYFGVKFETYNDIYHVNGVFNLCIDAMEFKELANKIKNDPTINVKERARILKISEAITENDNPVLLIGKMKEKVDF